MVQENITAMPLIMKISRFLKVREKKHNHINIFMHKLVIQHILLSFSINNTNIRMRRVSIENEKSDISRGAEQVAPGIVFFDAFYQTTCPH